MFIKSIRWRLQLWLAFLLVCTLSGFGIATFEAHRIKQYQQVDEELNRRFEILSRIARGPMFPGGRTPFDDRGRREPWEMRGGGPPNRFDDSPGREPPPDRPDERRKFGPATGSTTNTASPSGGFEGRSPSDFFDRLRQEDEQKGIYFIIWNRDGSRADGSTNTPTGLTCPTQQQPTDSGPHFRIRGTFREGYDFNREGRCVLVGRSIETELAQARSFVLILISAGVAVLVLGLAGGWLIASRAFRPVEAISATASRISAGQLAERINVADTDSELGQLAGTLNSTFARLEAAFAQQKQFTADASHELRTPIAVIISEAQTTLARERTAQEYRETVEACLDTAQQMRRLTESLLELANLDASQQTTKREPLDLVELARQRIEFIHPLADQRGLKLICKFSTATTSGNADHLGLVINNLLSNAIYYNKPGGEITVTTGAEAGKVFVTVADTGRGIAAEDLPFIFDRFYRADKSRSRAEGRSGLGLAICKAIVEAHGGSIQVASELGRGTTFTVRLPA
ncbi:MAG: ATP-binding protein [Verrucomicrobiota bacterium]